MPELQGMSDVATLSHSTRLKLTQRIRSQAGLLAGSVDRRKSCRISPKIIECSSSHCACTALGISLADQRIGFPRVRRATKLAKQVRVRKEPVATLVTVRKLGGFLEVLDGL